MLSFLLPIVVLASNTLAADYKVVCYYTSWSAQVPSPWNYGPSHIDPSLCTHVLYAFAVLDKNSLEMKASDADDTKKGYESIVGLKKRNSHLKVMLSLGGWTDSNDNSGKYAKLVKSSSSRKNFISKAISYLEKYKFDGLDIDWEYPTDKKNYGIFLKELNEALKKKNMLLSAAVSADSGTIDSAYDVPGMSKYLDMINVMTYDYSEGLKTTGENAPIDGVKKTIEHWISKGAAPSKVILGIPFYGESFTLKNSKSNGLGAPANGPGKAGKYTQETGNLAYFEICTEKGWTKKRETNKGAYAYKGDQWVGYDDPQTVEIKSKYIQEKKLGGAMLWDLSQDDFRGECCGVKNPLLNVMNNVLRGKGTSASSMSCH